MDAPTGLSAALPLCACFHGHVYRRLPNLRGYRRGPRLGSFLSTFGSNGQNRSGIEIAGTSAWQRGIGPRYRFLLPSTNGDLAKSLVHSLLPAAPMRRSARPTACQKAVGLPNRHFRAVSVLYPVEIRAHRRICSSTIMSTSPARDDASQRNAVLFYTAATSLTVTGEVSHKPKWRKGMSLWS
jgi:hypothetical protein